jgi:hypothetical protein
MHFTVAQKTLLKPDTLLPFSGPRRDKSHRHIELIPERENELKK